MRRVVSTSVVASGLSSSIKINDLSASCLGTQRTEQNFVPLYPLCVVGATPVLWILDHSQSIENDTKGNSHTKKRKDRFQHHYQKTKVIAPTQ